MVSSPATILNRVAWITIAGAALGITHSLFVPISLEPEEQADIDIRELLASREPAPPPDPDNAEPSAEAETSSAPADNAGSGEDAVPPAPPSTEPPAGDTDNDDLLTFGPDISLEQGKLAYDLGFSFIDARPKPEYVEGHIDGAFHLTGDMLRSGDPLAVTLLDPSLPVVVYCIGGDCSDATAAVIELQGRGFTSLHIMTVGYPAWADAGFPTAEGPGPLEGLDDAFPEPEPEPEPELDQDPGGPS